MNDNTYATCATQDCYINATYTSCKFYRYSKVFVTLLKYSLDFGAFRDDTKSNAPAPPIPEMVTRISGGYFYALSGGTIY